MMFKFSLIILATFIVTILSFNIDTKFPIIINNNADGDESYFGTSLLMLKEEKSSLVTWIIIGSPRANSSARNLENVTEPGQIWRCSVGLTPREKCEVIVIDPKNSYDDEVVVARKDRGWLGGSIDGNSKRFVSCSSRWKNAYPNLQNPWSNYLMHGQCYWRSLVDLTKGTIEVETIPDHYRLHPMKGANMQSIFTDKFYWAFGQAGFSSHITDTGEMILGAPGIDEWKGGFVRYYDDSQSLGSQNENINTFYRKKFVSRPEIDLLDAENTTYFGYAVSSGKFIRTGDSDERIQYVGGGPRANSLSGRVVLFQFPKEPAAEDAKLEVLQVINGDQIGSYFGSVLCSVDINNDGYDDLLIGAPNYNTKARLRSLGLGANLEMLSENIENETVTAQPPVRRMLTVADQFPGNGDEGMVYLYMSTGTSLSITVNLVGGNKEWSHFGSSIISLGDINKDGFKDIAVGSPFEDDHHGAVYIFLGHSDGIDPDYSQVIYAKDIDMNLRGFGYSLKSEVDVDNNGYDDISIGAHASNQVVVLRSKPVIKIAADLTFSVDRLPLNATEFVFMSCVSYTGLYAPFTANLGVTLTMDAEAFPVRVQIKLNAQTSHSTYTYDAETDINRRSCRNFSAIVTVPLTVSGKPIVIDQEVFVLDATADQLPFSRIYNIFNSGSSHEVQVNGAELREFCKTCGISVKRRPYMYKLPLAVTCGSVDRCISNLIMNASFIGIKEGGSFIVGSATSVVLKVTILNVGDPAFSPSVEVSWRKRHLVRTPPNCQRNDDGRSNLMSYHCSLGQILERNRVAEIELEIDMTGMYAGSPEVDHEYLFNMKANTTSELEVPSALTMILDLREEADIWITGSKLNLEYNPTINQIQPRKFATFQVFLDGYTPVSKVWLDFEIPVNLTHNSKKVQLFELASFRASMDRNTLQCVRTGDGVPSVNLNNNRPNAAAFDSSIDAELIEPISQHKHDPRHRKRDTEELLHTILTKFSKVISPAPSNNRKTLNVHCSMDSVQCIEIHCQVDNVNIGTSIIAEITMNTQSEVLNDIMKTHKVETIQVQSYGSSRIVGVDSQYIQPMENKADEVYATTLIRPLITQVPTWVYIVSVISGLLVLALIVLCLYCLGYFERKKKEEENNDEVQKEENEEEDFDETDGLRTKDEGDDDEKDGEDTEQVTENVSFSRR